MELPWLMMSIRDQQLADLGLDHVLPARRGPAARREDVRVPGLDDRVGVVHQGQLDPVVQDAPGVLGVVRLVEDDLTGRAQVPEAQPAGEDGHQDRAEPAGEAGQQVREPFARAQRPPQPGPRFGEGRHQALAGVGARPFRIAEPAQPLRPGARMRLCQNTLGGPVLRRGLTRHRPIVGNASENVMRSAPGAPVCP